MLPAVAGFDDDGGTGDGMQCSRHPLYGRANPGGICALCLQEKLGRLVSGGATSKQQAYHIGAGGDEYSSHSPSSPPPSIRPTVVEAASAGYGGGVAAAFDDLRSSSSSVNNHVPGGSRSRMIPFIYNARQKKKKPCAATGSGLNRVAVSSSSSSSSLSAVSGTVTSSGGGSGSSNPVFKRSKSVAGNPMGADPDGSRVAGRTISEHREMLDSPRKKSFWSFLRLQNSSHLQRSSHRQGNVATPAPKQRCSGSGGPADICARDIKLLPQPPQLLVVSAIGGSAKSDESTRTPARGAASAAAVDRGWGAEEPDDSPGGGSQASISSFGRKVARSRSVGCGSRSFSGEFLERISSGFGDCALRRVESQRESKAPAAAGGKIAIRQQVLGEGQEELSRQRVRCGGIFRGFSSTSSSSSSSSMWLSEHHLGSGRPRTGCQIPAAISAMSAGGCDNGTPRARRSWAWAAFSSPMRVFGRPSSKHAAIASVNGGTAAGGSPSFKSVSSPGVEGEDGATAAAAASASSGAAALLAVRG